MDQLLTLDRGEIRRYLGCPGPADPDTEERIDRCSRLLAREARPRTVWKECSLCWEEGGILLEGTVLSLPGKDIARHLAGCRRCILMAATLGWETERRILQAQAGRMADAVVLDACATAGVEEVCDRLEDDLRRRYGRLTGRFSPGYGDLPLELQPAVLRVLDAGRRIGLTLSPGGVLLPHKSVTAILGIDPPQGQTPPAGTESCDRCGGCPQREGCVFRKGGGSCGAARRNL